jgi:hypothetical protein
VCKSAVSERRPPSAAKGRATEEPARRNIRRVQEKGSRRLGPGEMEELVRLLRKLNDTIATYNMRTS